MLTLKDNAALIKISEGSGKTKQEVAKLVLSYLLAKKHVYENDPCSYGLDLETAISDDEAAELDALVGFGGDLVHFLDLVVMGSGDCPHCGGNYCLDEESVEGKYLPGHDSEPEYDVTYCEWVCEGCEDRYSEGIKRD